MEEEAVNDAEDEAGCGEEDGGEGEVPVLDGDHHAPGPPLLLALGHPPGGGALSRVSDYAGDVAGVEASFFTGRSHCWKNGIDVTIRDYHLC